MMTALSRKAWMLVPATLLASPFVCSMAGATATTADATNDYTVVSKLIQLPSALTIDAKGSIDFDKKKWAQDKQSDGTTLYTAKSKPEAKAAAIASSDGKLESFTSYRLGAKSKDGSPENSQTFLFDKDGKLTAATTCEDSAQKDSIGRICVTATPKLCQSLKSGSELTPEMLKENETAEMKSLSLILTLRGQDHQLDNVVRSGNRMGLKSALQTTKGQLIALAREIAIETGELKETDPTSGGPARNPSSDNHLAEHVLQKSLPKLKQTCIDTKFAP